MVTGVQTCALPISFDAELLDIYLTEAEEVLAHIAQNCQALRVNPSNREALVEVRRSFHTLKGSGRTVGLSALGEVAGKVETFLNVILDKKANLQAEQVLSIEQVSAAFAGWTAALRADNQVHVPQEAWLARIEAFSEDNKQVMSDTRTEKSDARILIFRCEHHSLLACYLLRRPRYEPAKPLVAHELDCRHVVQQSSRQMRPILAQLTALVPLANWLFYRV